MPIIEKADVIAAAAQAGFGGNQRNTLLVKLTLLASSVESHSRATGGAPLFEQDLVAFATKAGFVGTQFNSLKAKLAYFADQIGTMVQEAEAAERASGLDAQTAGGLL